MPPKSAAPTNDLVWELDEEEERTIERRVRVSSKQHRMFEAKLTRRMPAIAPRLFAVVQGAIDSEVVSRAPRAANDAYDDDDDVIAVDDDWLD